MKPFRQYRRTIATAVEMRPYAPGEELPIGVSISAADKEAGSPKLGDMIARNPKDHKDQWLVAKSYFEANFSPMKIDEQTSSRVSSIAARYMNFEPSDFLGIMRATEENDGDPSTIKNFCNDVQTIAGSALTQDKTPGQDVASGTIVDVGEDDAVVEAREIGGHDIDRDGPVKFES